MHFKWGRRVNNQSESAHQNVPSSESSSLTARSMSPGESLPHFTGALRRRVPPKEGVPAPGRPQPPEHPRGTPVQRRVQEPVDQRARGHQDPGQEPRRAPRRLHRPPTRLRHPQLPHVHQRVPEGRGLVGEGVHGPADRHPARPAFAHGRGGRGSVRRWRPVRDWPFLPTTPTTPTTGSGVDSCHWTGNLC